MRPRQGDRVVNTRGALIGHIRDRAYWIGKSNVGPGYSAMFTVAVGRQQYCIMEWDRSWAAWVAYGRRKS